MSRKPKPPAAPAPQKPPQAEARRPNRLLQPDARWQRFNRYVWDKKRG